MNFADEPAFLMANNVWNEGKKLTCGPFDSIMFHGEQCGSCVGVCNLSAIGSSYQLH
jgi:hypothetical protein